MRRRALLASTAAATLPFNSRTALALAGGAATAPLTSRLQRATGFLWQRRGETRPFLHRYLVLDREADSQRDYRGSRPVLADEAQIGMLLSCWVGRPPQLDPGGRYAARILGGRELKGGYFHVVEMAIFPERLLHGASETPGAAARATV